VLTVINKEIIVTLLAAFPILELRGAIPVGKLLGLAPEANFFWAVTGNMLPIFFVLKFLDPVSKFLMKHSRLFDRFMKRLFEKTRAKHTKKMDEIGAIALIALVAIPLPGTGAWTGVLIAYLFNIPYWKAMGLIFIGVLIAAAIVLTTVESATQIPFLIGNASN
jgi:uncharacterized membrane protein